MNEKDKGLENKNIDNFPPLILDNKWHELFENKKTLKMRSHEKELKKLLSLQGKLNTEHKEYTLLKKKIMNDIVENMSEKDGKNHRKTMNKNKKYIDEINNKLRKIEERLIDLPSDINDKNKQLIDESLTVYYNVLVKNKSIIEKMEESIKELKEEIKEKIITKDEMKIENDNLYGYIHDLVGADVMETYDKKYFGGKDNG